MKKNGKEFAFQVVENLGTLIEYENTKDFTGKSSIKIDNAKKEMLRDINEYDINTTEEYDVKKAFELIQKKYSL